jgi:hypothetical protein
VIYGFNAEEVFQIGIDIEENGKRFYEKAVDLVLQLPGAIVKRDLMEVWNATS